MIAVLLVALATAPADAPRRDEGEASQPRLAQPASSEPAPPRSVEVTPGPPSTKSILGAVAIGAVGLGLTAGYGLGAGLLGDQRGGGTLAIVGGVVAGGLLGGFVGLGLGALRKEPASLLEYVLGPLIGGALGAAVGGILSGITARDPGTGRVVTHVVISSLLFCETAGVVIARLVP